MPRSKVLAFADPFSFQTAISTADLELVPTARGKFSGELISVCMNRLWIKRFYQNLPLINTGTMKPGRKVFTFLASSEPAAMRHCGMEVYRVTSSSTISTRHQRTEAGFRMGSMSLTIDDLDAACQGQNRPRVLWAPFKHLVRPSLLDVAAIRVATRRLGKSPGPCQIFLSDPRWSEHLSSS
jgi:hypothetical protein